MNENMKCEKTKYLIFDYLTGRLDDEVYIEVKSHLKNCKNCQNAIVEMKETFNLLDLAKPPILEPEFTKRVMTDIEDLEKRAAAAKPPEVSFWKKCLRILSAYHLKPIPAFAAILIIFIGVFVYFRFFSPKTPIIHKGIDVVFVKPIKIISDNLPSTLSILEATIHLFKGEIVAKEVHPFGIQLTIELPREKESDFLEVLKDIDTAYIEGNYKNKEGNIVIFLEKK